jgi:hypothetical protein
VTDLARWTAALPAGILLVTAAVLCWRRVAGALSTPLEPAPLLLIAALVAAAAVAARSARTHGTEGQRAGWPGRLAALALSAAVVAIGAVLSLPGTSVGGLIGLWIILVAEECWARRQVGRRRLARNGWRWPTIPRSAAKRAHRSDPGPIPSAPALEAPPAAEVTQQMVRALAPDGNDVLSGWVRVSMALGQRSSSVHLAFCPPFARTPRVTVRQLEGPQSRIKTVQVLPHGARFDLKLAASSEGPETVRLQFSAETGRPPTEIDAAPAGPSQS